MYSPFIRYDEMNVSVALKAVKCDLRAWVPAAKSCSVTMFLCHLDRCRGSYLKLQDLVSNGVAFAISANWYIPNGIYRELSLLRHDRPLPGRSCHFEPYLYYSGLRG